MRSEKRTIVRNMLFLSLTLCVAVFCVFNIFMRFFIMSNVSRAIKDELGYYDYTTESVNEAANEADDITGSAETRVDMISGSDDDESEILVETEGDTYTETEREIYIEEENNSAAFSASVSLLPKALYTDTAQPEGNYYLTYDENLLVQYVAAHPDVAFDRGIQNVNLEGREFYFRLNDDVDAAWAYYDDSGNPMETMLMIFVNVSAIENIVLIMNILLLAVFAVFTLISLILGIRTGKKVEKEREKLKIFFENASHELKTPLMSIAGYAEGIEQSVVTTDEATKIILNETDKMSSLINDILSISKIDSRQLIFLKERLNMKELIDSAAATLMPELQKRRVHIGISCDDDVLITGDGVQLTKALTNVMSNAVRYAKERVDVVCVNQDAHHVSVTVLDDGDGIDQNDFEHIFDRFYTGRGGNVGIGLSLTQEILMAHGGTIRAENTSDGTAFEIILPLG